MTQPLSVRLGAAGAVAAFMAFGSTAQAQEGVAMKNILGSIGLIAPEKDPIQYRERAPLVLPPKMDLREPASREGFASANPQWPNDPDIARKRARTATDRVPVTESEIRRMSEKNPGLSPDELRRGRSAAGPAGSHRSEKVDMDIASMGRGPASADDTTDEAATPTRKTLAEPPSTLRQSARGGKVAGSFEPRIDQQAYDANPMNWLTRAFRKEDDE